MFAGEQSVARPTPGAIVEIAPRALYASLVFKQLIVKGDF